MSTERRLVLTVESLELRRRLDPTAWMVFEELLLASTNTGDGYLASVSIRALADRLGLAKDTIARALSRLHRAGLANARQSRTDTGVFATGSYLLTVPPSITVTDHTPTSPTRGRSARRPTPSRDQQLALTLTT